MAQAPAVWTLVVGKRSVDENGVAVIEGTLSNAGKKEMTLTLKITPNRDIDLFVHGEPGVEMGNFQARSDF